MFASAKLSIFRHSRRVEPAEFEFKGPLSDSVQPAFKPERDGIDYDQSAEEEIDAWRVVLESGEAWTLLDRNLVLLRRFVDRLWPADAFHPRGF